MRTRRTDQPPAYQIIEDPAAWVAALSVLLSVVGLLGIAILYVLLG